MSTKNVRKKLLNPFLHLLKGRLWTQESSSERLMHSLTAPSCSPFIYHFNLFAVSGKTEDTTSQRVQGSKGLLEVIDTRLSEQKPPFSTAFLGDEAALPRQKPTVLQGFSSAAAVLFRKRYTRLRPWNNQDAWSPTNSNPGTWHTFTSFGYLSKEQGSRKVLGAPVRTPAIVVWVGIYKECCKMHLPCPGIQKPSVQVKLSEQLQTMENKKCGVIIH